MVVRHQLKRRGTRSEYLVRDMFRKHGWVVVRSGGSLGPVDLVCMKDGVVRLVQVKSCKASSMYFKEDIPDKITGFQVLVIVNFGRGNIRVIPHHKRKASKRDGTLLGYYLGQVEKSGYSLVEEGKDLL